MLLSLEIIKHLLLIEVYDNLVTIYVDCNYPGNGYISSQSFFVSIPVPPGNAMDKWW